MWKVAATSADTGTARTGCYNYVTPCEASASVTTVAWTKPADATGVIAETVLNPTDFVLSPVTGSTMAAADKAACIITMTLSSSGSGSTSLTSAQGSSIYSI